MKRPRRWIRSMTHVCVVASQNASGVLSFFLRQCFKVLCFWLRDFSFKLHVEFNVTERPIVKPHHIS